MHKKFIEYLVDPVSREPLQLEISKSQGDIIESGVLRSRTAEYPIIRGIPRFAGFTPDNYTESFGYQWNKWSRVQFESENLNSPMAGHTTKMWEIITGVDHDLSGKLVLDMGCGPGRFIEVARKKGAMVIGLDFSAAVEAAGENFQDDPDVCIIQADALKLPIKSTVADGLFSIGVLHHTSNPVGGVQEAARVIKPGGWFGLAVYSEGSYYDFPSVQLWRRLFKLLWPVFKQYPPLIYTYATVYGLRPLRYIPFLEKAMRRLLPTVSLPDIRWSLLDTFDSVTPSYQSAHRPYEVFQWLRETGFTDVQPTNWGHTSVRGVKPPTDKKTD